MSWLWIYITLMEWVGIVLVVKALGDDTKRFSFRKTGVYFCVYVVYSVAFDYFFTATDVFSDELFIVVCIHLVDIQRVVYTEFSNRSSIACGY